MANRALQLALKLGFLSVRYVLKWVFPAKASIMLSGPTSLPSDLRHMMVFAVSSTSAMKQGATIILNRLSEIGVNEKRTKTNSTSLSCESLGKNFYHFAQAETLQMSRREPSSKHCRKNLDKWSIFFSYQRPVRHSPSYTQKWWTDKH